MNYWVLVAILTASYGFAKIGLILVLRNAMQTPQVGRVPNARYERRRVVKYLERLLLRMMGWASVVVSRQSFASPEDIL